MHQSRFPKTSTALLVTAAILAGFLFVNRIESEAQSREERVMDRSFTVRPGGSFFVDAMSAHVEISSGPSNAARVEIFLAGKDQRRAREYFDNLNFRVTEEGNRIAVVSDKPSVVNWGRTGGARISIRVQIPEEFDVDVTTSGGHINVASLVGDASLRTSGGHIEVGQIQGSEVELRTSGGHIRADVLQGDQIMLRTSGGHIEIGEGQGQQVSLRTSGGHVRANVLDGDELDVRTSGGSIRLAAAYGNAEVRTSGGPIEIASFEGALNASTSGGGITVNLLKHTSVSLRTSGGNVTINAPQGLRADVVLRANNIQIGTEFPFVGTLTRSRADGQVNGGGPRIEASTSGGTVTLAGL